MFRPPAAKSQKGFTLIELLVVILIIAVLSSVGLVSYRSANQRARDAKRKADVEQIRAALEMYKADAGSYPISLTFGGSLTYTPPTGSSITYLNPIPHDPQCDNNPTGRCSFHDKCANGRMDYCYEPLWKDSKVVGYYIRVDTEQNICQPSTIACQEIGVGNCNWSRDYCVLNP